MKKKLIYPMLLTGTFLLGACARADVPDDRPANLTMWTYYNGAQKEEMDFLVQEFNDTVGVEEKIIVEAVSKGSVTDLEDSISASADGKTGSTPLPNLAAAYSDTAFGYYQKGLLADFRPYLTNEEYERYIPGYAEEGNFGKDATMMIFPIAKSTEVLTLNETAWEPFAKDLGITTDQLSTWEGLAKTAKAYYEWTDAMTEEPNDGKAFFGRDSFANYMLIGSYQLGHELYSNQNGSFSIDADRDTMRRLWDNYYVPYISGYYLEDGKFRSDDLMTGRIIAYVGSSSGGAYTPDQVVYDDGHTEDIACRILALPNFEDTTPCAVQQGAGMIMFSSDERTKEACATFLKWLTAKEQNIRFSSASGYLPVTKEANDMDVIRGYFQDKGESLNPKLEDVLDTAIPQVQTYTLHTAAPANGAYQARKIIAATMPAVAMENRSHVKELLAEGMSLEDAVAQYNTDEIFDAWYSDTKNQLESLMD